MRAMSISISAKGFTIAASALALIFTAASSASAQQSEKDGMKRAAQDVKDVAQTPLEDVGLSKEEIAPILIEAAKAPYLSEQLTTCDALVTQIAELDNVLGDDYDIAGEAKTGISTKGAAKSVVGSLIPFRGLVREVSGAAGDKRKSNAAMIAGMVRRGYLKGLGEARGCAYPARPKPAEQSQQ